MKGSKATIIFNMKDHHAFNVIQCHILQLGNIFAYRTSCDMRIIVNHLYEGVNWLLKRHIFEIPMHGHLISSLTISVFLPFNFSEKKWGDFFIFLRLLHLLLKFFSNYDTYLMKVRPGFLMHVLIVSFKQWTAMSGVLQWFAVDLLVSKVN